MRRSDTDPLGAQSPMRQLFEALEDLRGEGYAIVDVAPYEFKGASPVELVGAMERAAVSIIDDLNDYEGEREHVEVEVDPEVSRHGAIAVKALAEHGYAVLVVHPAHLGEADPDEVCRRMNSRLPQLIDELKAGAGPTMQGVQPEQKSVIQALREQAVSELLIIEPGVTAAQALASLDRAYREGIPLEGCSINVDKVGVGGLSEKPSYVWGMAMGLSLRLLRQAVKETGLCEGDLADQPAADFDVAGICKREHARAAQADALYLRMLEEERQRMADFDYIPL